MACAHLRQLFEGQKLPCAFEFCEHTTKDASQEVIGVAMLECGVAKFQRMFFQTESGSLEFYWRRIS